MPQQPFPRAMFAPASSYSSLTCHTNPAYLKISQNTATSRTLLVNSGQPLNDMFKYLPTTNSTRLGLAESTLRWRHMAPTAPDTLWCHPYFTKDPFIFTQTPDVYIIGNQPQFQTRMVTESGEKSTSATKCRVVLVPGFAETGILVLLNLRTLDVRTERFAVAGMSSG